MKWKKGDILRLKSNNKRVITILQFKKYEKNDHFSAKIIFTNYDRYPNNCYWNKSSFEKLNPLYAALHGINLNILLKESE